MTNWIRYGFIVTALLIFAVGTGFRVYGLGRGLEYDEIWTLETYIKMPAAQIFRSLATPNNHPLNSLLIQYSLHIFGFSSWSLRLPALLCGLASIPLAGLFFFRLLRSKPAALTGMLLIAFNPMLIAYSQTARGYAIQTCMLLLLALLLVIYEQTENKGAVKKYLLPGAIFFSGMAVVTSVTSGIIFVASLLFLHCLYMLNGRGSQIDFRMCRNIKVSLKSDLILWMTYLLIMGFSGKWFLNNYQELQAAKNFGGTVIHSFPQFVGFVFNVFTTLQGLWLLPIAGWGILCCLFPVRRVFLHLGVAAMCLLPLLAALAASSGPPRAYVPLIPFLVLLCLLAGMDFMQRLEKSRVTSFLWSAPWFFLGAVSVIFSLQQLPWLIIDWVNQFSFIRRHAPLNSYICYPANDAYPAMWNNRPKIFEEAARQTAFLHDNGGVFIQLLRPKAICGMEKNGGEVSLPISVPGVKLRFDRAEAEAYLLYPVMATALTPDDIIIAAIGPVDESVAIQWRNYFLRLPQQWIVINFWLTTAMRKENSDSLVKYFVLATKRGDLAAKSLQTIEQESGKCVRFYVLRELVKK